MRLTPLDILVRLSGALFGACARLTGDDLGGSRHRQNCLRQHWRPFLKKPVFIGVTGSVGKTTTKELLLGMLGRRVRGWHVGSLNNLDATARP